MCIGRRSPKSVYCTCYHTKIGIPNRTYYLALKYCSDTGPTSFGTGPVTLSLRQGGCLSDRQICRSRGLATRSLIPNKNKRTNKETKQNKEINKPSKRSTKQKQNNKIARKEERQKEGTKKEGKINCEKRLAGMGVFASVCLAICLLGGRTYMWEWCVFVSKREKERGRGGGGVDRQTDRHIVTDGCTHASAFTHVRGERERERQTDRDRQRERDRDRQTDRQTESDMQAYMPAD